jgi:hypothetical protein
MATSIDHSKFFIDNDVGAVGFGYNDDGGGGSCGGDMVSQSK